MIPISLITILSAVSFGKVMSILGTILTAAVYITISVVIVALLVGAFVMLVKTAASLIRDDISEHRF